MLRISPDSPALIAVRQFLSGLSGRQATTARRGRRQTPRLHVHGEQLEPRMVLDGAMRALLPDLVAASDTGVSSTDNLTHDRTPALTGSVVGAASEVRLIIEGKRVATVPVVNGAWNYAVPATAALRAGKHTILARPVAASGELGPLSKPLIITIVAATPAAPTVALGPWSDTGVKGDGKTTFDSPILRGVAQPGVVVSVSIDGIVERRVKADDTTGEWAFKAPRLASGIHEITAESHNRVGLRSVPTSFNVTIDGERQVVLDGSSGNTVELMASHLLGRNSQGFIVTGVQGGTLQRWSMDRNAWLTIPKAPLATDPTSLRMAPPIRKVAFHEVVRWTPDRGVGTAPAFSIVPMDMAGGLTAPTPEAGTVPGKVVDAKISPLQDYGSTISWSDPTDGCGCASTRYSIEVIRQDGRTLLYNVPRTVHGIPSVEGGAVMQARIWGATKTGAGEARSFDLQSGVEALMRLDFSMRSGASFIDLGTRARTQLTNSPTPTQSTTSLSLGGSHAGLAYLEVSALPDATEAAEGLPAGTPMIISSNSNHLSPAQRADLEANPIYASRLFPGTVDGKVKPDQVRALFQAGERLRFAGTVAATVRTGATVVVEAAQNLGDGSLGPWLEQRRITVGPDGGYAYDYSVPYGLNSVRVRLEYRVQPGGPAVGTSSTSAPITTPIDLSNSFNAFGITTPPWQVGNNQGFDGKGNYYNSDYNVDVDGTQNSPVPGTPITYNGISFPIGPVPTNANQVGGTEGPQNFVRANGQTINVTVDADKSDYLYLAGAASNGNQLSQNITLKFTDGTTETWTQSFHDWASDGPPQQAQPTNQKLPVKAATTASITLSGLQTVDGVALAAGDRVLVKNQTYEQKNGIYVVSTGAWSRAKDAYVSSGNYMAIWNASTMVLQGTINGGKYFVENTDPYESAGDITFIETTPPVRAPRPFAGELLLKTEPERINQLGNLVATPAHIFAYCRNLHGKQLESITLPNNGNVGILSAVVSKAPVIAIDEGMASFVLGTTHLTGIDVMAMTIANESNIGAGGGPLTFFFADRVAKDSTTTPPTYTTTQVTVPMGQQTTIAYIAPDSTSQMNFYVQKADDTCVGSACSTYLTDWADGSGSSSQWASNILPSLNSQMQAGQHWTMTIQNAGLGYNGYLSSPSGQGLPGASGSTPAGAQFKLMTQNEINDQPHWATALEKGIGTAAILVGVTVLTAGTGDAEIVGVEVVDATFDSVVAEADEGSMVAERVLTDSDLEAFGSMRAAEVTANLQAFVEAYGNDLPMIVEVDDGDVQWGRGEIERRRAVRQIIKENRGIIGVFWK